MKREDTLQQQRFYEHSLKMSAKRKNRTILIHQQILKSPKFKWLQFTLIKKNLILWKKHLFLWLTFLRLFILVVIQLLIVRAICKSV